MAFEVVGYDRETRTLTLHNPEQGILTVTCLSDSLFDALEKNKVRITQIDITPVKEDT